MFLKDYFISYMTKWNNFALRVLIPLLHHKKTAVSTHLPVTELTHTRFQIKKLYDVAAKYGKNLLGIKYHYYNKHHLSTGIFT
jgi:hypothetical protein